MANGDLLNNDYEWQLHDTLFGCGAQGVSIESGKSIEGLGPPDVKTQDVNLVFGPGSIGNPDYFAPRLITIPGIIKGTPADVATYLSMLNTSWPATTADTDLAFQLPGPWKFVVNGRPRGAKADTTLINRGAVRVLFRFDALDPTITAL